MDRVLQARMKMFKYKIPQYRMADHLGIRDDLLSKMFTGRAKMPDETLQKIEEYLEQIEKKQKLLGNGIKITNE